MRGAHIVSSLILHKELLFTYLLCERLTYEPSPGGASHNFRGLKKVRRVKRYEVLLSPMIKTMQIDVSVMPFRV